MKISVAPKSPQGTTGQAQPASDFFFCQVNYSNDALLRWRESADVNGPVYAGVMVLARSTTLSSAHCLRL